MDRLLRTFKALDTAYEWLQQRYNLQKLSSWEYARDYAT